MQRENVESNQQLLLQVVFLVQMQRENTNNNKQLLLQVQFLAQSQRESAEHMQRLAQSQRESYEHKQFVEHFHCKNAVSLHTLNDDRMVGRPIIYLRQKA